MSTTKRIEGDWNITTTQDGATYTGNVIINTHTVEVNGNLDVAGNLTYINVTELNIRDPFILLNSSNTSSYSANSGVLVHKTETDFAGIRWSNVANSWQVSASTSTTGETGAWVDLLTAGTSAAGANTEIQFNDDGDFGASADYQFDTGNSRVILQGHQVFGNIGTAPAAVANSVAVYHNAVGGGDTGLYARTTASADELVSKRRSIAFGLIF
jgi:hypothetical protein